MWESPAQCERVGRSAYHSMYCIGDIIFIYWFILFFQMEAQYCLICKKSNWGSTAPGPAEASLDWAGAPA